VVTRAPQGAAPIEERRYLSVVFIDLVGYTSLSERLEPEDLGIVQRRFQALAVQIVERFGGFVARFLGDGILAYFGFPTAHENDAERAMRAALELIERLPGLDTRVGDMTLPQLEVHIGVHTGLVLMMPEISSRGSPEQGATGAVLNLAARLQAEAPPGAVIASKDTVDLLGGQFEYLPLGPRLLKGLSRPVELYRVLRPLPGAPRFGNRFHGATRLVGREAALSQVLDRWRSVREMRHCETVAVVGEAGIGKTRLVLELFSGPEFANATITQTPCHEIFASTPLYPVGSFLWGRAGLAIEDEETARLRKVSTFLDELGLNSPENQEIVASLLGLATAGIMEETAPTPLLVKRKQYDFVVSAIRRSALIRPTILWVEDAHWLDPSSAELLREVVSQLADMPLLVLLTMRPFPRGPLLPDPDEIVSLSQLNNDDCHQLALSIQGAASLPEDVVMRVIEAAEGVPLFLEHLVISLIEELSQKPLASGRPRAVPLMLAEMLSERLDRRPGGRRIVQAAACIGRPFTPSFLSMLLLQAPEEVLPPLQSLVEAEILLPKRFGMEIRYEFRHILVQRMAYELVMQTDRRALHSKIVDILRKSDASGMVPPEILAHHLTEARQYPEAVDEWLRAGVSAAQRSAHVEAIEHFRKGLVLLDKVPDNRLRDQLELKLQAALIGPIMATEGATSLRLSECCQRGLQLFQSKEPSSLMLPFVFGQFTFSNCRGYIDEAASLAKLFLTLAERVENESGRVIGHRMLGAVRFGQGEMARAREQFETSLNLYVPERDTATTHMFGQNTDVHTKSSLSLVLLCIGEVDEALKIGIDALRSADMLRHPHSTAIPLTYVGGWLFGLCGAATQMIHEAQRLLALAKQHHLGAFHGHGTAALGWALSQRGDVRSGATTMEAAIALLDSIGFKLGLAGYLGNWADSLRQLGDLQAAKVACDRAMEMMHDSGFQWFEPELRRIGALIAFQERHQARGTGERMLREAATCAQRLDVPLLQYRCLISLKECLGPDDSDFELESNLRTLARFDNLPHRVVALMEAQSESAA
jgi:class 3 adenylate cyclase/predicted ATPase